MNKIICVLFACFLLSYCGNKTATESNINTLNVQTKQKTNAPEFNQDSAYTYVGRQVMFGPRVPNSEAHKNCAKYLARELERFGAQIYVQEAILTAYNGDKLEASNIIGVYNPDQKKRVLLFAHWDSRPYSDEDREEFYHTPIDGADDGASGVGVLLEIARQIGLNGMDLGVDIIFFDAEDHGTPSFISEYKPDTWCLGAQFWAKNPHVPGYRADFGILFDMVGSKDATFYKEATSRYYAAPVVEKVWSTARELGYGKYFINMDGGGITDDHQYVITGRNIPCIDIINLKPGSPHGFGVHWHTQNDTMDHIDHQTLKAVGQTVLDVIYNYK
ncbi:MAG: M28 family peptidase [Tannerella sp.]|jgi:Zn-dependent M28 family amino/carboxypeptidase|nr:M28 family peptidase [Tannerella sp.]